MFKKYTPDQAAGKRRQTNAFQVRLFHVLSKAASFLGIAAFAVCLGLPAVMGTFAYADGKGETIDTGKGWDVGDPIAAGSGAYHFVMPLFRLGGPMDLGFDLFYRSDRRHCGHQLLPGPFWWSPLATASSEFESGGVVYATITLPDSNQVSFMKNAAGDWVLTGPTVDTVYYDNIPRTKYKLKETTDYLYLMDPVRQRIYTFHKYHVYTSSTSWNIIRIADRFGNALVYSYGGTPDDIPSQIVDNLGRTLDFTYGTVDTNWRLMTVTDQGGRQVVLSYDNGDDNGGNVPLRSVTDPEGNTTGFAYAGIISQQFNLMASRTMPLANVPYTEEYDSRTIYNNASARVISQEDAYNNTMDIDYDNATNIVTTQNPDTTTVQYKHYSEHGFPESWTDPEGKTAQFAKSTEEQLTGVTDRLGDTTNFTYHAETGKPASTTNAKGDTLSHTYTAQDQTFTNPDNAETVDFTFYNLTRTDYPDGTNEQFTYDATGNVLTRVDRAGKTWTYTYNGNGQVLTATNPAGGTTTYTYNADATLASSTDSDTGTTTYDYDTYKRLNKITHPDGKFIQMVYDLNDRVTSITDENDHTYTYTYDANGNLTKVTDPAANETGYAYDLMDRVNQVTDQLGKVSTLAYDNMGRNASVTDPNNIQTSFGYDDRGWWTGTTIGGQTWQTGYDDERVVSSSTTPLGYSTAFQTDKLGHTTGITDPLSQTTTFTRDSMGRITAATDPLGRTTGYSYDARGLVSGVTLPVVGTALYTRNDMGFLSGITDLNGSNWIFDYTNMGRMQSSSDPLGNTWQHTYDNRGRPAQTTYPDAATLTRTYDDAGNITQRLYSGGLDLQYAYDELDRLLTANGIAFTRDVEGRVTTTDNPGTIFGATYDDGGRLATATYNNGAFTVTYTYESSTGLLSRVTDDLTNTQIDFSYDNDMKCTGITRSNGVNAAFTYDNAARLTRIQEGGIIDIRYTLDAAGQVTQADMTVPLDPVPLLVSETNTFTYDAASEVSSAGYTYDSNGRQTAAPGHTYAWDNASHLTGVDGVTLAYNGLSDLTARTEGAAAIHYYYNYAIGLKPIAAEKDEVTKQFLRYYVWTPGGRLLYMIDASDGNKAYFYHFNRIGSTLALTDASGTVTDSYAYTPYGKLLQHSGSSEQPFTFVGAFGVRHEGESGNLYHMRARYYDAQTASFITRDPVWPDIINIKGLSPYQYAAANPLTYIDPWGEQPTSQHKKGSADYWGDIAKYHESESEKYWEIGRLEYWIKQGATYSKARKQCFLAQKARTIQKLMQSGLFYKPFYKPSNSSGVGQPTQTWNLAQATNNYGGTTYISVQNVGGTSAKMTTSYYSTSTSESNRESVKKTDTLIPEVEVQTDWEDSYDGKIWTFNIRSKVNWMKPALSSRPTDQSAALQAILHGDFVWTVGMMVGYGSSGWEE